MLCLISGGGSALLAIPGDGLTLADKQAVNKALLKSGANIAEMNCVRKHLSAIKGGRLAAAAYPARWSACSISDVPGDDPSVIGSGPTVADPTTRADAHGGVRRNTGMAMRRRPCSAIWNAPAPARRPSPAIRASGLRPRACSGTPQPALRCRRQRRQGPPAISRIDPGRSGEARPATWPWFMPGSRARSRATASLRPPRLPSFPAAKRL